MLSKYRLSRAHAAEGESPPSRAWQARLSRPRRLLRTATVRVVPVEVASHRPAGLRRPAVRWAAVAPVQAPPRSEPRSYQDRGSADCLPDRRGRRGARLTGKAGSSPAEADPSQSQAGVLCLVPSCHRSGPHPGREEGEEGERPLFMSIS